MAANWSEVTAIATSILAMGLLGAIGAAVFAAQQVREARRSREAQMAVEFFRRWNEEGPVEPRRCRTVQVTRGATEAFAACVAADAPEAYVVGLVEKLRHELEDPVPAAHV